MTKNRITILYSLIEIGLEGVTVGNRDEQRPSDICRDYLGSGGNGLTFKHVLKDFYFAVKWVCSIIN